jgi:uncharacterized protein YceH (UPF0502 family)
MNLPPLDAVEVRVLGSLIEKDLTTPEYYPLSLNALVNACNQSNNRDPVVAYGEPDVTRAMDRLREKRLAAAISGGDNRVVKFRHTVPEVLELDRPDLGLLCVLLLRGPQTPGELRTRSARMHEFADLAEVHAGLGRLASRTPPLAAVLPRQPGTKESRHAQLLGGPVEAPANEPIAITEPLSPDTERMRRLESDVAGLRLELAALRDQFAGFRRQFE